MCFSWKRTDYYPQLKSSNSLFQLKVSTLHLRCHRMWWRPMWIMKRESIRIVVSIASVVWHSFLRFLLCSVFSFGNDFLQNSLGNILLFEDDCTNQICDILIIPIHFSYVLYTINPYTFSNECFMHWKSFRVKSISSFSNSNICTMNFLAISFASVMQKW